MKQGRRRDQPPTPLPHRIQQYIQVRENKEPAFLLLLSRQKKLKARLVENQKCV